MWKFHTTIEMNEDKYLVGYIFKSHSIEIFIKAATVYGMPVSYCDKGFMNMLFVP